MRIRTRSYKPFVIAALVTFLVGLAIGGWQGNKETVLNSVSALLLTVGVLAFVVSLLLEILRRRRLA
jgi:uncharacterized membrane protein YdjX (TVP38/TMEM64 family)